MTVANLSSSSNYFHLLRAQAANLGTQSMRPLVIMSPKSLLRNKTVSDPISKFTSGKFEPILTEEHDKEAVKKVFDVLAPRYATRNGGYTRILKLDERKGDDALIVILELVEEA